MGLIYSCLQVTVCHFMVIIVMMTLKVTAQIEPRTFRILG